MAAAAGGGCIAVAIFELIAALIATPAPDVRVITALRLLLIDITLIALFWVPIAAIFIAAALGHRLLLRGLSRDRALAHPGLLAPVGETPAGPRPGVARLWAAIVGIALYAAGSSVATFAAVTVFQNLQLTALLLSLLQLIIAALAIGLAAIAGMLLLRAGRALDDRLGAANPLGRYAPALPLVAAALFGLIRLVLVVLPELGPLIPWRLLLSLAVLSGGVYATAYFLARRDRLARAGAAVWPASARARRGLRAAGALLVLVIIPLTLLRVGGDHEAKSVAMTGSPLLLVGIDGLREITDIDRDGYGFFLGENDCSPFEGTIHPLARDIPDNGIDEDCNGRDFSFHIPPTYQPGDRLPVPEEYRRDWNILLLTVDTVRYDHTGFGGYIAKRGRDTTPELDKLVERSVSFTFANAPSAGTMASIPAILTSKFFHSGIALDEDVKPRMPPRLRPENLLISEILEERGYYSGAILSHYYFNDWGMEQGFDTYDNDLGKKNEPFKVTSHDITDKAIAWVARNQDRKWFLWAHYIDPHGRYVAHPGERSFGTTEEDLYDGELYYTDKHLGRLFRELSKMPGANRTIIFITSDHGDGFKEHGFINHGMALYRELLHVPLIVHIPEVPPRQIPGAVSPLDIFPTICDLVDVDTRGMALEGESLVPQIFYGKDAHKRVVFAETNWPKPLRAAITSKHKLIYRIKGNLYELFDLQADPWEKKNIYSKADEATKSQMKGYLEEWLERVYFTRDVITNQAAAQRAKFLLAAPPSPAIAAKDVTFDDGRVTVLGIDTDRKLYSPGETIKLTLYLRADQRPSKSMRIYVEAWLDDGDPARPPGGQDRLESGQPPTGAKPAGSKPTGQKTGTGHPAPAGSGKTSLPRPPTIRNPGGAVFTGGGLLPSSRWRAGEHIRDDYTLRIPKTWQGRYTIKLGLGVTAESRTTHLPLTGAIRPGSKSVVILGQVELGPPAGPAKGAQTSPANRPK